MGRFGKHEFWLVVLFTAFMIVALFNYMQPVWVRDSGVKVANALEQSYAGSRFDRFEVSVEQCEIRIFRKDTEACESGSSLQAFSTYIDLRHHEAEIIGKGKPVGDMWSIFVDWKPIGEWKIQTEEIRKDAVARLEAARKKYGRGQEAVIAANENYAMLYDVSEFHSLGTTEYCPYGKNIGPFTKAHKLVGPDAKELVRSVRALMQECSDGWF